MVCFDTITDGPGASLAKREGTSRASIGRAKWNGGSVDFVNGAIDDVRFFDTVLDQTAVTALYGLGADYPTTVLGTSGLVNYWRLGEATTSGYA